MCKVHHYTDYHHLIKMSNLDELEYVWQGKYFKDDKHLNDLRGEFLQNLESNVNSIESDINACEDELQRIQLIKKLFKWIPVPQYYFERKYHVFSVNYFFKIVFAPIVV